MNRRSVLGIIGSAIGLVALRMKRTPYSWRPGDRIVRQQALAPGQIERCCSADSPDLDGCTYGSHVPGEHIWGRTPVAGSPERAYLERMGDFRHDGVYSEGGTLRRIQTGELAVNDVTIRLASAEEIDALGSGVYAGVRGEAHCEYITVYA